MIAADPDTPPGNAPPACVSGGGWLAFATGLNLAFALCFLICKPPWAHALTWGARLRTGSLYLLVACGVGALVTWIMLPRESRPEFRTLVRGAFPGWIFLPAIALFLQLESIWAQLLAAAAASLMAVSLHSAGAIPLAPNGSSSRRSLFAIEISPSTGSGLPFLLSLLAYGALLSTLAGETVIATAILASATFLGVLRFVSDRKVRQAKAAKPGNTRPYLLCALAFCFILISLSTGPHIPFAYLGVRGIPPKQPMQPPDPHPSAAGYRTIILWPTEKPEKTIQPPPKAQGSAIGIARPVVIPFFGPYWYFKFPGELPGLNTRTSHGDPLKANVRSTDAYPLLMEAHQHLDYPIDLTCCRELQIVFRNDASAGAVAVGITLEDSHSSAKPSQDLGAKVVASRPAFQPTKRR
jgi:hypothetical protein